MVRMDDEDAKLRLPPHSIEAEQSSRGLLLNNRAWEDVADILNEEDFTGSIIAWSGQHIAHQVRQIVLPTC